VCVVQCALSPLPSLHTHLKDRDTLVPNHVKPRNCRDKTDENKDHVPARRRSVIRQEEDHKRGDNREGEWDDEDRGVARRRGDRLHQRGELKKEVLREHETSAARRREEEEKRRRTYLRKTIPRRRLTRRWVEVPIRGEVKKYYHNASNR